MRASKENLPTPDGTGQQQMDVGELPTATPLSAEHMTKQMED